MTKRPTDKSFPPSAQRYLRVSSLSPELEHIYLKPPPPPVSIKEYNEEAQKWVDAINQTGIREKPELTSKVFKLGGLLTSNNIPKNGAVQITTQKGKYSLRINVGSENTLRQLITLSNWDVQVATQEGSAGAIFNNPPNQATFTVPRIRVPVKGITIPIDGDEIYVSLFNQTNNALIYDISIAIIQGRPKDDPTQGFDNNSGGDAPFSENTHHFSVSVPGGVVAGDTIQVRAYDGALLQTFPAREGGVWRVHQRGATARYVPIGPVVSNLSWTWYRLV